MSSLFQIGQLLIVRISIPCLVFVLVWIQLHWLDKATDELEALPEKIRRVLDPWVTGERVAPLNPWFYLL